MQKDSNEIFNYFNIVINCQFPEFQTTTLNYNENRLIYIYSGQLLIEINDCKMTLRKGECIFVRKGTILKTEALLGEKENLEIILLLFSPVFLKKLYHQVNVKYLPMETGRSIPEVVKLPLTPDLTSLFQSFTPYFKTAVEPAQVIINLKILEAIYSLLNLDKQFFNCLFDFGIAWKSHYSLN
ncbi:hypothetical protein GKZ90_0003100 [Flavobacterium sp. MC2016-06]|jgi:hypothetical protein|uniref:hypothetical protein n=1 Tax=Flavobacterium sp. MC2016-06 TaxID=2676308 RepID=UPI0012BA70BB|nr:hypothetical protein [Flavobacterium sp. MC2016-06]MBU3860645.1 hypothetical protein [Flavobacterium sp. MC2016-06]